MGETGNCREYLLKFCEGNGLDIGAGGDPIKPDCISIDLPTPYLEAGGAPINLRGDARDLYWFADGTFDFVFSSHLLEDFPPNEMSNVMAEWLRVIKPGGFLVLYSPDEKRYRKYCESINVPPNGAHQNPHLSLDWFLENLIPLFEWTKVVHTQEIGYSFTVVLQR